jgi:hypothetical protein
LLGLRRTTPTPNKRTAQHDATTKNNIYTNY